MAIELYALYAGAVEFDKSIFIPVVPRGNKVQAPVLVFFIRHPRGNILVDTGIDPEAFEDPEGRWGGLARAFYPRGTRRDGVLPRLTSIGVHPRDVAVVVNTHLHMDHAGGNRFLPQAVFYVQVAEMEAARSPQSEGKGYFRSDWDHPLKYHLIDGDADLFGDGSVLLKNLPGHSSGSQSVALNLDGRRIVLVSDACPLSENLSGNHIPKITWDREKLVEGWKWLREQERQGAMLIFGHDPEQWPQLEKLFPAKR